jgi:hypothetical protein
MIAAPAAAGASFKSSYAVPSAVGCYEVRLIPEPRARPAAGADTVRLLNEVVPERSDPSWRRARAVGASPVSAVLLWREIDSVTVELQVRGASDTSVVRFRTTGTPAVVRPVPGVRAAFAVKVMCP